MPFAVEFLEWQFVSGAAAANLRAKGRNPDRDIVLVGVVMLLAPGGAAFLASFLGLSFVQLSGYAAFSFGGVALWGWRHRRFIGSAA